MADEPCKGEGLCRGGLSQLGAEVLPSSSLSPLHPWLGQVKFSYYTVSGDELHEIIITLPLPALGKTQKVIFPPLAA